MALGAGGRQGCGTAMLRFNRVLLALPSGPSARPPAPPSPQGCDRPLGIRLNKPIFLLNGKPGELGCEETLIYPFSRRSNE